MTDAVPYCSAMATDVAPCWKPPDRILRAEYATRPGRTAAFGACSDAHEAVVRRQIVAALIGFDHRTITVEGV